MATIYQQIKKANPNIDGKSKYCLRYTRRVFGVRSWHPRAWVAWLAAKYKHTTPLPNVAVPVWFSYKARLWGIYRNWGHVAAYVPGEGIYSTTKYGVKKFASTQEVANYFGAEYVGWSEDINGVRVVKPKEAPKPKPHFEKVKNWTWYVRSSPVTGKRLGVVKGGQKYDTQVLKNGWRKITFKGKVGYVGPAAWRKK